MPVITLKATSSQHERSIPREDRFPRAYAYTKSATNIAGSYGARPAAPSRYAASNRSRSICSTAPKTVHTKWFSGSQSTNDGGINNN